MKKKKKGGKKEVTSFFPRRISHSLLLLDIKKKYI